MATVLYVTANPKSIQRSFSLQVGKAFINSYELTNPLDDIIEIDLYREEIPLLDYDVFNAWDKLNEGVPLTMIERKKLNRIHELTDQFISADKYVFVTPMWNFSFPPMFKAYIDAVCMAGKAFHYTERGPVGLLYNRKAVHIQARGGYYMYGSAKAMEYGDSYLRMILGFMGITDIYSIVLEGTLDPYRNQEVLQSGLQQAKEVAVWLAQS